MMVKSAVKSPKLMSLTSMAANLLWVTIMELLGLNYQ